MKNKIVFFSLFSAATMTAMQPDRIAEPKIPKLGDTIKDERNLRMFRHEPLEGTMVAVLYHNKWRYARVSERINAATFKLQVQRRGNDRTVREIQRSIEELRNGGHADDVRPIVFEGSKLYKGSQLHPRN